MITLVLGGARSGKSALAERLVGGDRVSYIATAVTADDPDMAARIEAHRRRRPASWVTVEAGHRLVTAVRETSGDILIDSLTAWVAAAPDFAADVDGLCAAMTERTADVVVVSDEVGLGVHPSTDSGRRFRDALGLANQAVSGVAGEVLLVVAGRALRLEAWAGTTDVAR